MLNQLNSSQIESFLLKCPKPFIIILVGIPLSGKDTFLKTLSKVNFIEISRDKILLEFANTNNYREAYCSIDSKIVDKELNRQLLYYSCHDKNLIANMTHLKAKRRINTLSYFNDKFFKIAIVFPIISLEEFNLRNIRRNKEEMKNISIKLYNEMRNIYEDVNKFEGFDKVIELKVEN